jgi:hypothetical protein
LTAISLLKTRSRILSYIDTPNISRVIIRKPKHPVPVPYFLPDEPSLFSITCHLAQLKIVADMEPGRATFRAEGKTESGMIAFDLSMQYKPTSVLGALTLEYLSTTSLAHLTTLVFDWWLRYTAPSEDAIQAFFANLPSLRHLIFPHLICDDFIRPFVNSTTLCPDLESVSVEVSKDTYEKTVQTLAAITSARAAMGKTVRISVAAVKGEEGLSELLEGLYVGLHIQRF